jgi:hypothetical protein
MDRAVVTAGDSDQFIDVFRAGNLAIQTEEDARPLASWRFSDLERIPVEMYAFSGSQSVCHRSEMRLKISVGNQL